MRAAPVLPWAGSTLERRAGPAHTHAVRSFLSGGRGAQVSRTQESLELDKVPAKRFATFRSGTNREPIPSSWR
ncbi:protein of unknown function [Candidatus Bipolaricaulis anaerobius]|uniref:Uncharacterized protein n=1 Tax=Candidatus Bipolaricaulis anaerobius TaxID=2026885 RepID=A0A2X3K6S6_9BACT|nr:protein of unknown function [Candidatus Bipolaricaulis anaerobius]